MTSKHIASVSNQRYELIHLKRAGDSHIVIDLMRPTYTQSIASLLLLT